MTETRHGLSHLFRSASITTQTHSIRVQLLAAQHFSSIPPRQARLSRAARKLEKIHYRVPEYPYGPSKTWKQSNYGLYGGLRIKFGNIVNKTGLITTKARRTWKPNIHWKQVYSAALKKKIRMRITTRVLRTIDKVGGLDNYLLGNKAARIKELGVFGWKLRWRVMQTKAIKQKVARLRFKLGLPTKGPKEVLQTASLFKRQVTNQPERKTVTKLRARKWRRDLWQDDMVPKLMLKYGNSEEKMHAMKLKGQHEKHKQRMRTLKLKQQMARDLAKMMPRDKPERPNAQL